MIDVSHTFAKGANVWGTRHDFEKNVTLNGSGAWSSTMDGSLAAWGFNFNLRLRRSDPLAAQDYYWALCVR